MTEAQEQQISECMDYMLQNLQHNPLYWAVQLRKQGYAVGAVTEAQVRLSRLDFTK